MGLAPTGKRRLLTAHPPFGLRGEDSAELGRREGIVQNLYYRWSKKFLEAGKKRLTGETARAATWSSNAVIPPSSFQGSIDIAIKWAAVIPIACVVGLT